MSAVSRNVAEFLLEGKERARGALQFPNKSYRYGELLDATQDVANYIAVIGGQKGDRALLISDNSFFWVAAYLGTLRAGLVSVPLPAGISSQDLAYVLDVTGAHTIFAQSSFAFRNQDRFASVHVVTDHKSQPLRGALSQTDFAELTSDRITSQTQFPETKPDDLAALMFTSGSSGRPRGVMISHGNIIANTESIIEYLGLTALDRIMAVLPFHYCFGTSLLHTHLRCGGQLVVDARFMYPEVILERMIATECTGFAGVPSHFQILLRNSSLRKKYFPHLRYVQQAGGHLAPTFVRELRYALPNTQIFIMYGQTEATARLAYLPPQFIDSKAGCIGKAIPGVNLRVLNGSGQCVRPGEVGEIVADGDNVALGYWPSPTQEPADCTNSFRDGRLYTGDLATVDADGFIYVVDRAKDFLKCGGKRISCRQIEDRLLECEEVLEAAVIGIPDQILGESVKAFIVPRAARSDLEESVRHFCKKNMAPQLVPREIAIVQTLPKNSSGKVMKQSLRAQ